MGIGPPPALTLGGSPSSVAAVDSGHCPPEARGPSDGTRMHGPFQRRLGGRAGRAATAEGQLSTTFQAPEPSHPLKSAQDMGRAMW